jgi:membrane protease YdiL (CAAX protease family)
MLALGVLIAIPLAAPWLHTEAPNPLLDLLDTTQGVVLLGLVVVAAGGIREEIQRAFVLTRFEHWLGGARVGLVVGSLAFGAGHWLQGADAVIATTALGAFWGVVYLRRRSIVAPVVSHSLFNLLQLTQALIGRTGP